MTRAAFLDLNGTLVMPVQAIHPREYALLPMAVEAVRLLNGAGFACPIGNELSGALAVGMRAALIRVAYDEATDADRPEVLTWKGLELQALADVLAMAAGGHP